MSWDKLSMAEKAEVMRIAVEGGVYDLDAIRNGYNEYAKGGRIHIKPENRGKFTRLKERTGKSASWFKAHGTPAQKRMAVFALNARKWKHEDGGNLYGGGGFASLVTTPILPDIKEVRHRLYNGINPAGYQEIPERIWDALNKKESNRDIYRDDQWATYLQIPEEERHSGVEKLQPARYRPSVGNTNGDVYRMPLNEEDTDVLIQRAQLSGLGLGKNMVDRSLAHYFGDHTVGRGHDKKGEYISYYDEYDLNPFAGATRVKTGIKSFDKWLQRNTILPNSDLSMGIGKPFEIYDRIYLDDYYSVPKEARGGNFLPEITVTGKKKKALGGNLFSGEEDHSSQMNIGLNATNGWQPYTLGDIVANGENVARQRKALQDTFLTFPVESNDATVVSGGRPQNTHLEGKAVRGGAANAAWEKEHPGLAQLGYAASAVPFAIASAPLLGAAAETGAGQAVTAGLGWLGDAAVSSPLFTNAASRALGTSSLLPWLDAGMTAGFGAHGIQETAEGNFTPMTALEVAPLGRLAKPIAKEAALAVENYRYPLGRPQVPENFLTVNPQVRTRVGDVEIDNPNLLYHLDRGDRTGAFSNQGAYVEDGVLFPGTPKDDTVIPYSWWNKGKPYAVNVGGQPMTRLMTTTEDTPGMLHVRSQNYPIGQWNGRRGFVTNAEYVDPEGVDVSGSTYTLDPDYGWRRVFAEETPAAEWAQTGKSNRSPLTLSEEELQEEMERWAMEELGDGPYYRASSYKGVHRQ